LNGSQGVTLRGVQGLSGNRGFTNLAGRDAAEAAVANMGYQGFSGGVGIRGPQGSTGGEIGAQGQLGIPGSNAPLGMQGPPGMQGAAGRLTHFGPQGQSGPQGNSTSVRGAQGRQGIVGAEQQATRVQFKNTQIPTQGASLIAQTDTIPGNGQYNIIFAGTFEQTAGNSGQATVSLQKIAHTGNTSTIATFQLASTVGNPILVNVCYPGNVFAGDQFLVVGDASYLAANYTCLEMSVTSTLLLPINF
jgi:hypothetical protein